MIVLLELYFQCGLQRRHESFGSSKKGGSEMAILNYTTTVDALKTISEIEYELMKHGAKAIMKNIENGSVVGLSFVIGWADRCQYVFLLK